MAMVVSISLLLVSSERRSNRICYSDPDPAQTICSENCKPDDRKMTAMRSDGESFLSNLMPCATAHRRRVSLANYGEREFGLPII
jgi:hypothetical protein